MTWQNSGFDGLSGGKSCLPPSLPLQPSPTLAHVHSSSSSPGLKMNKPCPVVPELLNNQSCTSQKICTGISFTDKFSFPLNLQCKFMTRITSNPSTLIHISGSPSPDVQISM